MFEILDRLRCISNVNEKRNQLSTLLNEFPFVLELWVEYVNYLANANGENLIEGLQYALQAVGVDPRSIDLWVRAIEAEKGSGSTHFRDSACCIPLLGALRLRHEVRDDITLRQNILASEQVIQHELSWPDSSTALDPSGEIAGTVQQDWDGLLHRMFQTLELGTIPAELQLRRMDHAYCLLTFQLPFEDSNWLHHAIFKVVHLQDHIGAVKVLEKGISMTGSNVLKSFKVCLTKEEMLPGELESQVGDFRLIVQKQLCGDLPKQKKEFRNVGKMAEAHRVSDWRIYNQWAVVEEGSIEDVGMASKVLERGLACIPSNSFGYSNLAHAAERHFLWRHSEGEVLSIAEKRIDSASRTSDRGQVACSWNRMLEYERKLGLLWTGKMETRAAAATCEKHVWYLQQGLRHRVGHLSSFQPRELEFLSFLRDVADVADDGRSATDYRSDKLRRLEGPPRVPTQMHSNLDSSWLLFQPVSNPHPPTAVTSPFAEDEVCGPRVLRGALVHKVLRDDLVEARLTREENQRGLVRKHNLELESTNTSGLPRQLGTLVSHIEAETNVLEAADIELLQRVNVRWLMSTLSGDLDLGVSLKKDQLGH